MTLPMKGNIDGDAPAPMDDGRVIRLYAQCDYVLIT
jgi:hypothetical protein